MKTCFFRSKISSGGSGQQGFTLVEVLIAMCVFSIGIMAVTAMAVRGFNNFSLARAATVEANRSVKTIDTFRFALYTNAQIFNTNVDQPASYPFGNDNANFQCWDFDDLVVQGVKFVTVENQQIAGPTASGFYRLHYTKPGKQQVN